MDDVDVTGVVFLVAVFATFALGLIQGMDVGKNTATKETIIYCMEQPSACKVKYDYYKLENKNE